VQRWTRWSSQLFVAAAVAWFGWTRFVEPSGGPQMPALLDWGLIALVALTLPGAFVGVLRRDSAASRRNWLILLALVVALIAAVYVF